MKTTIKKRVDELDSAVLKKAANYCDVIADRVVKVCTDAELLRLMDHLEFCDDPFEWLNPECVGDPELKAIMIDVLRDDKVNESYEMVKVLGGRK